MDNDGDKKKRRGRPRRTNRVDYRNQLYQTGGNVDVIAPSSPLSKKQENKIEIIENIFESPPPIVKKKSKRKLPPTKSKKKAKITSKKRISQSADLPIGLTTTPIPKKRERKKPPAEKENKSDENEIPSSPFYPLSPDVLELLPQSSLDTSLSTHRSPPKKQKRRKHERREESKVRIIEGGAEEIESEGQKGTNLLAEVLNLLQDVEQEQTLDSILKQQQEAHAVLLKKYNDLHSFSKTQVSAMMNNYEKASNDKTKATERLCDDYKEENQRLREEISSLMAEAQVLKEEQMQQLQNKAQKETDESGVDVQALLGEQHALKSEVLALMNRVKTQEKQIRAMQALQIGQENKMSAYALLTSTKITLGQNGVTHCKCVNRATNKILEFNLILEENEVQYLPISTNTSTPDSFWTQHMVFEPQVAPLFTKRMLELVYGKGEGGETTSQTTVRNQEEEKG